METSLQEKLEGIVKQYWLPLGIGILGLIFLGYGMISSSQKPQESSMTFEAGSEATASAEIKTVSVVVDVSGAVYKPGVYTLSGEARVQDGLIAAGGMNDHADREKVAKSLNLAAKLTDGAKLYIPFVGDQMTASSLTISGGGTGETVLGTQSGLININTASASELDTLKGVGSVTASKIIDNRPYGSVDELLSKKVVGQKVFSDIKEKVTVY